MKSVTQGVMAIKEIAEAQSFNASSGSAKRVLDLLQTLRPANALQSEVSVQVAEQIGFTLHQLSAALSDELAAAYFMSVETAHASYLEDDASIFGEDVDAKFPKAVEDISEAAKCLALGRNTACVFHLMRVSEHCVKMLGKRLKVAADVNKDTWYKITTDINNAVDKMPNKTATQAAKKQKYALAYSNLNGVRMAWRNDVMHPKATYTKEEALNIFSHVGALLKSLVPLA